MRCAAEALKAAWRERGSLTGSVFHSDHGAVYTSKSYTALCEQLGMTQSMGAIGSSADNALAESFNAALKRELLEGRAAFPNAPTAYRAVFRWANCPVTGLLEAFIPRKDESHGSTEEVPG